MDTDTFTLENIYVGERLRPLDPTKVKELAESIKSVGLMHRITVRVAPEMEIDGQVEEGVPVLVAGHHRLEALRSLGNVMVECNVIAGDGYAHELAEIDENLVRSNLSSAEEAMHIDRRKIVYEKMHPETKHGAVGNGRKKSRQNGNSTSAPRFTEATARATGKSERNIDRAAQRGAALGAPTLNAIVGTSLDKPGELDALVKTPPEARQDLVRRAQAGEMVSAKPTAPPRPTIPQRVVEENEILDRIKVLCEQLDDSGREQLMFWLRGNLRTRAA